MFEHTRPLLGFPLVAHGRFQNDVTLQTHKCRAELQWSAVGGKNANLTPIHRLLARRLWYPAVIHWKTVHDGGGAASIRRVDAGESRYL